MSNLNFNSCNECIFVQLFLKPIYKLINGISGHKVLLLHVLIVLFVKRLTMDARKFQIISHETHEPFFVLCQTIEPRKFFRKFFRKFQFIFHETHDPFFVLCQTINYFRKFNSYLTKPKTFFNNKQIVSLLLLSHCLTKSQLALALSLSHCLTLWNTWSEDFSLISVIVFYDKKLTNYCGISLNTDHLQ